MSLVASTRSLLRTIYAHPYNREKPFFAFYRLLRWQFHKKLSRGQRVYDFWGSRRIACYPDSLESMWLVYNYYMDWDEFQFIRRYARADDTLVDVGTNIGVYTLWMSQFVGAAGRLVGFEPDPRNFERCRENLALNRLERVTLERLALSDQPGSVRFSSGKDMENHLVTDGEKTDAAIVVEATTLDRYCAARGISRIDFLKIDVEGAEFLVLKGASSLLESGAIGVMQLEITDALEKYGLSRRNLLSLLERYGYRLYTYDLDRNAMRDVPEGADIPQNTYAVRDIAAARARLER